jgi:hypothetical protein
MCTDTGVTPENMQLEQLALPLQTIESGKSNAQWK